MSTPRSEKSNENVVNSKYAISLQTLILKNNHMGDNSISTIISGVNVKTLQILNYESNQFGDLFIDGLDLILS